MNNKESVTKVTTIAHMVTYISKVYDIDKFLLLKLCYNSNVYKEIMDSERLYLSTTVDDLIDFVHELRDRFGFDMTPYEEYQEKYIK